MAVTPVTTWSLSDAGTGDFAGTSGAFVPANNSVLVVEFLVDTGAGTTPTNITISGGGLTWTPQVARGDSEGTAGFVAIYTAPVTTGESMTVSVTVLDVGVTGGTRGRAKCYIVDDPHATTPIGNVGENSSTTNNWTPTGFITTTAANSYVFVAASEWNALGAATSSDLDEEGQHLSGIISGLFGFKTVASAGATSVNLDAAGSSAADWNAVGLEILVAAGAAAAFPVHYYQQMQAMAG